ncbi:MAG: hypothetical protein Q9M45_04020 [Robiginitomaculum sp.]|nr:hypothetical protein [Robiginitomaculum sp.]
MSTDSPKTYKSEKDLSEEQYKINPDPRYWTWFEQWWAQDFSWEGLAEQTVAEGNTQEYYR